MYGYEFTNPSRSELQIRRQLLDQAGRQGYLLPVVLLCGVYVYRLITTWLNPDVDHVDDKTIRSSTSKTPLHREEPSYPLHLYRRLSWILNTTYTIEYGPLYVQIFGVLYTVILLYITIMPAQRDYLHLTKAFGHVAVSQLPLLYALSLKTPLSPVTLVTGLTHERLNAFHRLLGRIVHVFVVCHVLLYLNFFVAKNLLWKRIRDVDVLTGVTAFWSLNLLGVMAMPYFRKLYYHAGFYRVHVVVSAVILTILWFHVTYTRVYVGQAGALGLLSWWSRKFGWGMEVSVSCTRIGDGLVQVVARLNADSGAGRERWKTGWWPGMHAYLNQDGLGPKSPFTVLSVEQEQQGKPSVDVVLVARYHGGPTTGLLSRLAKGEKNKKLMLEGPYGASGQYMPRLLSPDNAAGPILIVAGGVGATYALPIYMALLKARNSNSCGLQLLWMVKKSSDCRWAMRFMLDLDASFDVQIFVTGEDRATTNIDVNLLGNKGVIINQQRVRPDMKSLVDTALGEAKHPPSKVSVMVCGPSGLARSVRSEVGRYVMKYGTKVAWHEEQFDFGGS